MRHCFETIDEHVLVSPASEGFFYLHLIQFLNENHPHLI